MPPDEKKKGPIYPYSKAQEMGELYDIWFGERDNTRFAIANASPNEDYQVYLRDNDELETLFKWKTTDEWNKIFLEKEPKKGREQLKTFMFATHNTFEMLRDKWLDLEFDRRFLNRLPGYLAGISEGGNQTHKAALRSLISDKRTISIPIRSLRTDSTEGQADPRLNQDPDF